MIVDKKEFKNSKEFIEIKSFWQQIITTLSKFISKREIARIVGVSPSFITHLSKYPNRIPSLLLAKKIIKLAKQFDIPLPPKVTILLNVSKSKIFIVNIDTSEQ